MAPWEGSCRQLQTLQCKGDDTAARACLPICMHQTVSDLAAFRDNSSNYVSIKVRSISLQPVVEALRTE
jgi:hypothetical protein